MDAIEREFKIIEMQDAFAKAMHCAAELPRQDPVANYVLLRLSEIFKALRDMR